jgi:hypothetical protein
LRPAATSSLRIGRTPCGETLRAVEGLGVDPSYFLKYRESQRLMVYGSAVEYISWIGTLTELAGCC